MKTIISKTGWQDFIVTQESRVVKINQGKDIKWVDEKSGIAEHSRFIKEIVLYEDEYSDAGRTGKATRVLLNKEQILELADKIRAIEASTFEDIFVPNDDLPF